MENKFLSSLKFANFFLACLIVFHHAFNIDISCNSENVMSVAFFVERYMYNISECAVPMFYFNSGYLFFRTYKNTIEVYWNKLEKRIFSLLVPYLIFNTLGYIKHIVFSSESPSILGFIFSLIESSTMPLWFVRELFILALLSPIIYFFIKRRTIFFEVCVGIIILVISNLTSYRSFVYWIPFYAMGGLFAVNKMLDSSFYENKILNRVMYILTFFVLLGAWFLPNGMEKDIYYNSAYYIFRSASVFVILFLLLKVRSIKIPDLADCSFFIYCTHFPVISLVQRILQYFIKSDSYVLLSYGITVICAITIPMALAWYLKTNIKSLWQVLNGGR